MASILTKPQLSVNGVTVDIVPNSFTKISGFGERKKYVKSAGGNSTEVVTAHDLTSRIGKFKVHVINDSATYTQLINILQFQQNGGTLEVSYSDVSNTNQVISGVMTEASIVNDPEFSFSADDPKVELEFEGSQIAEG